MSYKISLVGLEGSGKTTLAKALNDQHQINNMQLEVNEDMPNSDIMIFCIDGSNMQQLHHNKAALEQINGKEQLIILQTKADIQTIEEGELRNFLGVGEVPIMPISAQNGDGLPQLINFLSQQIQQVFISLQLLIMVTQITVLFKQKRNSLILKFIVFYLLEN